MCQRELSRWNGTDSDCLQQDPERQQPPQTLRAADRRLMAFASFTKEGWEVKHHLRTRFWLEVGLGIVTAILAVLTLVSKEWIELVFGVDPDQGSGTLEWALVGLALAVTLIVSLMARQEWRRARLATASTT